jgi:methionyl aminopeptidase
MIVLRSDDEISSIRGAAQIVKATLDLLETLIKPGVSTAELDAAAGREILKRGGCPAFKGVRIGNRRYPSNICTSINEIVVHGIPSDRTLVEGDLVSIDAGVKFKGYYADAAITVGVGRVSPSTERLISASRPRWPATGWAISPRESNGMWKVRVSA